MEGSASVNSLAYRHAAPSVAVSGPAETACSMPQLPPVHAIPRLVKVKV